jgi:DNA-binding MurR/RpiR family transcriptional regulator
MARDGGSGAILSSMAKACLDNTERMFSQQSVEDLDRAVESMVAADRVFVMGLGLAYALAYNLWYVARMAFDHFVLIPHHGGLASDDLVRIGDRDCLIAMTFQPYRKETIEAMRMARARGARTICLTDSVTSPLCREADLGLVSPTHTAHVFQSNSAVTALAELLCALLVARGGDAATKAIEDFQSARWDADVYEET